MIQENELDVSSAIRADPGFKRLVQAVALGEGFQLLIIISDSPPILLKILQFLKEDASSLNESPVTVVRIDPYPESIENVTEAHLIDNVLSVLVYPSLNDYSEKFILAIDGSGASSADETAWGGLFRRMNERRNTIIRKIDGIILLCITPGLYQVFAREASDFWSIRNAIVTLTYKELSD